MSKPGAIAAFPMYDFAPLRGAHAVFWSALAGHLNDAGIEPVPDALSQALDHEAVWAHPQLLLGQACEYPLSQSGSGVRLVATPRYTAPGCAGPNYRSAVVVRRDDPAQSLEDLRGRRCVINDRQSNSGMNLLRATIAPVAQAGRFFDSVAVSGSHRQSIDEIVGGRADVAAIDCVTLALVSRFDAAATRSLRVLAWTPASPSLPFITAAATSDRTLGQLRAALHALSSDLVMARLRTQLFLDGFDLEPQDGYVTVLGLERSARELGYPLLH